jgi:tRNA pseudouridine13 synthase
MMNEYPFATPQRAIEGGEFRAEPEDFVVEEIPAYELSGRGDHVYFLIEKRNLTSFEVMDLIGKAMHRKSLDIGCAGLKDKRGVTRQWMSLEHVSEDAIRNLNLAGVKILDVTRHRNKLRKGHLTGNKFAIVISGITRLDEAALGECLDELRSRGVPNYFGLQRLGADGSNAALGRDIVLGKTWGPRQKQMRKLRISAYRSELFNRVLARRIGTYDKLLPGDLAFIHANGAVFAVANPEELEPRRIAFEISPSGPEYGHGGVEPGGEEGKIERETIEGEKIPPGTWENLRMRASRRPLRVKAENLEWRKTGRGIELSFALRRGAYATSLIREILKHD